MMDTVSLPISMKNVLMMDQIVARIQMLLAMTSATLKTTSKCAILMVATAASCTKLEMVTVTPSILIECVEMMMVTVIVNTT